MTRITAAEQDALTMEIRPDPGYRTFWHKHEALVCGILIGFLTGISVVMTALYAVIELDK